MNANETSFEFQAGILLCGRIRDYLDGEIFKGRKIRYREGRGWTARVFNIAGEESDMQYVLETLVRWEKTLAR